MSFFGLCNTSIPFVEKNKNPIPTAIAININGPNNESTKLLIPFESDSDLFDISSAI